MMEIVDPKSTCRSGQAAKTCVYLCIGYLGTWTCGRTDINTYKVLTKRLEDSDYVARGQGAWVECQLKTTSQKEK